MKGLLHITIIVLVCVIGTLAQTAPDPHHFEKDGLSFDYPAAWQISDQSTSQMQVIQIMRGDGYAEIRVRVPREFLKSPEKEAQAKKLVQDKYVEGFVDSLQQAGLKPNREEGATEIAGGPAVGMRIHAVLGGEPGGMDSYYRVVSDRFAQISQLGSEREMKKSLDAWDLIRNSLKVAPLPSSAPATKKP
jgi:hypothetical protein